MSELPSGWTRCALGDLATYVTSGSRDWSKYYSTEGALFVRTENINQNLLGSLTDIARVALPDSVEGKRTLIKQGDLLITITGANVGKCAHIDLNIPEAYVSQSVALVRLVDTSLARFIHRQLIAPGPAGDRTLLQQSAYGLGRPVLNLDNVREVPLVLAPASEQKRIADKLDTILARVDACRERLDRVPAILKRFRQSVLAAATSGKLTKKWREESHLIGSIPASWSQPKIKDVGRVQLGRQRAPKFHSGVNMRPYLRVQNVFEDRLDLSDVMEMDFPESDYKKYKLHVGDILLNEGQSPELLGRPAMFRGEISDACFTNTLIRFQANSTVRPSFALLVFRHYMHSGRFQTEGTITTNIAHLGAGRFAEIEFPLPPLNEQDEIVRRVESLFAYADRLEARYKAARAQVERLTPVLLAKAFRGELVPQDPNDEPASVLLERIRAIGVGGVGVGRNKRSISGIRERRERPAGNRRERPGALSRPTAKKRSS